MNSFIKVTGRPLRVSAETKISLTGEQIRSRKHALKIDAKDDAWPTSAEFRELAKSGRRLPVITTQTVEFKAGEIIGASMEIVSKAFREDVEAVNGKGEPLPPAAPATVR